MNYKNEIEENYNIKILNIEKMEDSTVGNVYLINTEKEKFIMKIYEDVDHVNRMIQLHTYLVSNKFNIPKIIQTSDKNDNIKIGNDYIVLYSFMHGKKIKTTILNGKIDANIIKMIAKTLRKMHDLTSGKNRFNFKYVPFIDENIDLNKSTLHFDFTRNNIFVNNNEIEIIDFDDAKYGPSVCDVAIAVCNLFFSKTQGVDLEGANLFIDEYYTNEESKRKEIERPLIKEYAIKWIDYVLYEYGFDTSTTESFEVKKKLVNEML